jgi:CrcB protein
MSSALIPLWVALGSAIGGVGRYWCSGIIARWFGETFPWGTLFVNIVGRLLIGTGSRQFILVGVCGGFTTFSSFSLQTLNLMQDGEWLWATGNIVLSVAMCLLGVWLGHSLAVIINR